MKKALLFVNGEPPKHYPNDLQQYDFIACTDGAYHNYVEQLNIIPHYIIGDLDSLQHQNISNKIQIIATPDQSKTDFEKALLYLADHGVTHFDILGATGKATDHFLGNLTVAIRYYKKYYLTFYDNFSRFFFAEPNTTIEGVKDKIISLIPLTPVRNLTIKGFQYPLTKVDLEFTGLTSLRNKAINDKVNIAFSHGDLLIFIEL